MHACTTPPLINMVLLSRKTRYLRRLLLLLCPLYMFSICVLFVECVLYTCGCGCGSGCRSLVLRAQALRRQFLSTCSSSVASWPSPWSLRATCSNSLARRSETSGP